MSEEKKEFTKQEELIIKCRDDVVDAAVKLMKVMTVLSSNHFGEYMALYVAVEKYESLKRL